MAQLQVKEAHWNLFPSGLFPMPTIEKYPPAPLVQFNAPPPPQKRRSVLRGAEGWLQSVQPEKARARTRTR